MPPSAGRLRLLQRLVFTAQLRKDSGPQARASRRLLHKDPGHRAASNTRDADLGALPPHLYAQHVRDCTQAESLRLALGACPEATRPRSAFKGSSSSSSSSLQQLFQKKVVTPLHGRAPVAAGNSTSQASGIPGFASLASLHPEPSPEILGGRSREPPCVRQPRGWLRRSLEQAPVKEATFHQQATEATEDPYVLLALRRAALNGR
ncbi:hypothetical protein Esti_000057 [Eimeria stiedai]